MARGASALDVPLVMTTLRLLDECEAIRHLSLSTRQGRQICTGGRGLGEGAGPCGAEFDRRTQRTVIAPMTFTAAKALPDSAPVADEHFLLHPWHYHALSRARFMRTGLREVRTLRVDDELRHSSSVEVGAVF
jgi:hypothetical protein